MGLGALGGPARRAPPTLLEGAGQAPPLTGCLRPIHIKWPSVPQAAAHLGYMAPKAAARAAQGRQRKREAGLSAQQRSALNTDFLEEEEVKDRRQYLLEDEDEVGDGELLR